MLEQDVHDVMIELANVDEIAPIFEGPKRKRGRPRKVEGQSEEVRKLISNNTNAYE